MGWSLNRRTVELLNMSDLREWMPLDPVIKISEETPRVLLWNNSLLLRAIGLQGALREGSVDDVSDKICIRHIVTQRDIVSQFFHVTPPVFLTNVSLSRVCDMTSVWCRRYAATKIQMCWRTYHRIKHEREAVKRIEAAWLQAWYDPCYAICRRRLIDECCDLISDTRLRSNTGN